MRLKRILAVTAASLLVVTGAGALAVGDYVYTSGTEVACAVNADDLNNFPETSSPLLLEKAPTQDQVGKSGLAMT